MIAYQWASTIGSPFPPFWLGTFCVSLLHLLFVALSSQIIMMSQNRQGELDRIRARDLHIKVDHIRLAQIFALGDALSLQQHLLSRMALLANKIDAALVLNMTSATVSPSAASVSTISSSSQDQLQRHVHTVAATPPYWCMHEETFFFQILLLSNLSEETFFIWYFDFPTFDLFLFLFHFLARSVFRARLWQFIIFLHDCLWFVGLLLLFGFVSAETKTYVNNK